MESGRNDRTAIRFGEYELDLQNRELRRSGIAVDLQPQAFDVLALLASRPNTLVTRSEIQTKIWPAEPLSDVYGRLNFHIKNIRQALGDDSDNPTYVQTVPKSGYKFIAVPAQGNLAGQSECSTGRARNVNGTLAGIAGFLLVLGIAGYLTLHPATVLSRIQSERTRIGRVSSIHAAKTQGIIIEGKGFGPPPKTILHIPEEGGVDTYGESYSTSIRIDDLGDGRHHWVAGRASLLNDCAIGLKLASWTDTRIVLSGFAGPLGTSCSDAYQIAPGDKLEIVVWGPENRCGPGAPYECPNEVKEGRIATFDTVVLPALGAQSPSCR